MQTSAAVWLLLLLALLAANLPFLTERMCLIGPKRPGKAMGWRLLELLLLLALVIGVGRYLEFRQGQIHPQGWEFYAAMACLFLTFAFPGFVWRYLQPRKGN
jgi:hypothetical protein